jgi:hypothetical protein
MSTVPLWQHVLVILALLIAHTLTFHIFKRRVEELQAALVAKEVLLGEDRKSTASIVPGGTMVLTIKDHVGRMRIWSRYQAALQISFEDAA